MKKEQIDKVLGEIQSRANKKFNKRLFKTENNDEILFVFDKRLEQDMPPWKRRYYKAMRKDFDQEKISVDEDVGKEFDEYIDKEIKKAIKKGLIPKEYVQDLQNDKVDSSVEDV